MIVAGFDPGLRTTGWSIVRMQHHHLSYLASGSLKITPSLPLEQRLGIIKARVSEIMTTYRPDACAIEDMFVGASPKSALLLAHARGVILCEIGLHGIAVGQYSPRIVKRSLTQNGSATKEQVQFMIRQLLPKAQVTSHDEADALAVAVCHAHHVDKPTSPLQTALS